ncbi:MAG: hypothetical protein ACLFR1_10175, partial [Spirochaetia bacterium]
GLAYYARGNTYKYLNSHEKAEEDYANAVKYGVEYHDVWLSRAEILQELSEYEKALDCYLHFMDILENTPEEELMLASEPQESVIQYFIAKLYYLTGRYEKAEHLLVKCLDGNAPMDLEALLYLIAVSEKLNKQDNSREYQRLLKESSEIEDTGFSEAYLAVCPVSWELFVVSELTEEDGTEDDQWSDGYSGKLILQGQQQVCYCGSCKRYHHRKEVKTICEIPDEDYAQDVPIFALDDYLTIDDYRHALRQVWPEDIELDLRKGMLKRQNHGVRRGEETPLPVDPEHHDNLERLLDLVSENEEPLFLAEIYRELGDFKRSLAILERYEPEESRYQKPAELLTLAAKEENLAPIRFSSRKTLKTMGSESLESFEQAVKQGFYPVPETEDVYAFPNQYKQDRYTPVLTLDLSLVSPELEGRATLIDIAEDLTVYYAYDRLFFDSEYEEFLELDPLLQEELKWFWQFSTHNLPEAEEELDRYYRILYGIFYDIPLDEALTEAVMEKRMEFEGYWKQICDIANTMGLGYKAWFSENSSKVYWDLFFLYYDDRFDDFIEDLPLEVRDAFERVSDYEDDLKAHRESAVSGLDYVEIGGEADWFQGSDKSVNAPCANPVFIAQVWTDYLDFGASKLLYLFYCPNENTFFQTYDYD